VERFGVDPDVTSHLDRNELDPDTAGRLLDGLSADDVPAPYTEVARLLNAARGPVQRHEVAGEAAALAAFAKVGPAAGEAVAAVPAHTSWRTSLRARLTTRKLAVAAVIGGLSMFSGLAAAGALPGAAQQAASDALAKVGISVPSPNSHANGHADSRGKSASHHTDATDNTGSTTSTTTKGSVISNLARTTDATGADKGATISKAASDGKSHAGEDHPSTTTTVTSGQDHKPSTPPSSVPQHP